MSLQFDCYHSGLKQQYICTAQLTIQPEHQTDILQLQFAINPSQVDKKYRFDYHFFGQGIIGLRINNSDFFDSYIGDTRFPPPAPYRDIAHYVGYWLHQTDMDTTLGDNERSFKKEQEDLTYALLELPIFVHKQISRQVVQPSTIPVSFPPPYQHRQTQQAIRDIVQGKSGQEWWEF